MKKNFSFLFVCILKWMIVNPGIICMMFLVSSSCENKMNDSMDESFDGIENSEDLENLFEEISVPLLGYKVKIPTNVGHDVYYTFERIPCVWQNDVNVVIINSVEEMNKYLPDMDELLLHKENFNGSLQMGSMWYESSELIEIFRNKSSNNFGIDFTKHTLLTVFATGTVEVAHVKGLEKLSTNKYKLNVEIIPSDLLWFREWTVAVICNKLSKESVLEVNVEK